MSDTIKIKNNKKLLQKIVLLFGIIATIFSCSKDKGNYDYTDLDLVTINVDGLPTEYSLLQFDSLKIKPEITYKGQKVNLDKPQFEELAFSWEMYPGRINPAVNERHLIDSTAALNTQIKLRQLIWELVFTVTNKKTGVKAFAKFGVAVTPALAEGWMVLYERNGNTDVGLIKTNDISKTQTKEEVFLDIYAASNNAPIPGLPGSLVFSLANLTGTMRIYIQTSKTAVSVDLGTFRKIISFDDGIFWTKPAVTAPAKVAATDSRKELMINNNKLHVLDYTVIAPGDRAFYDGLGGTYGTLAPWVATSTSAAFDAIVYDQTNKKFLKVALRGAEIVPIATAQSVTAPFNVSNVGMEFLMADLGWNNWEHMVMKDNEGKHFLLTANFKEGETPVIGKGKYDMSNCPEITAINSVTAGFYGEIFYYSANNHLYQFKYTPGTTGLLWTAPTGEVVTNITLQKSYNSNRAAGVLFDPKNLCKFLYVATYNETTKIGSVYQMEVNTSSGAIIAGTEKKFTGFGKIKAMSWKAYIIR